MGQESERVYKEPGRGRSFGGDLRLGGCKRQRRDIDLGGDSSMGGLKAGACEGNKGWE